jgi:diaminohydroxyphosphoribosylaminopyrimidine deaminase/5-amino-6-(5-phosphoribosylamino)uracil reductase
LRVALDSQLQLDQSARFFAAEGPWLVANLLETKPLEGGSRVKFGAVDSRVDINELLGHLAGLGMNEVLVEAGPTLAGAFLRQGLVDELVIYMAPKLMGSESRPLFDLPLELMAEALPLHFRDVRYFGQDLRILASLETD